MFNSKKRQINQLTAENEELRTQIAGMEGDPYYSLAQGLAAEVEAIVSSRGNTDTRIDDAIARRRAELFDARIAELAQAEIAQQTAAQKAEIEREALTRANELAAAALARFLSDEAAAYRETVQARLDDERPRAIIQEAKRQIAAEERQKRVDAAAAKIRKAQAETIERERLKERAQRLRALNKNTHILPLDQLQDGDPLTLGFTQKGRGNEPLTESDGYNNLYRSYLEKRKISGHIVDVTSGIFETEKDSWLKQAGQTEQALRGGQQVRLLAQDLSLESQELLPHIVKGAPLVIQTLGGVALPGSEELDVWWVNLGDFRALS